MHHVDDHAPEIPKKRRNPALKPAIYRNERGNEREHRNWTVRRAPGRLAHRGLLNVAGKVLPCVLGRAGISAFKREGDRATPAGTLHVLGGGYRRDRLPLGRIYQDLAVIGAQDGWCDDPAHAAYNRPVHLPFAASHEKLMRDDRLYDVCLVLDWNWHPRMRGRGSAIFLHLTSPDEGPTQGCVAVDPSRMRRLLNFMRPGQKLKVLP